MVTEFWQDAMPVAIFSSLGAQDGLNVVKATQFSLTFYYIVRTLICESIFQIDVHNVLGLV